VVVVDFEASDFIESDALDFDASDFIESLEAAGAGEVELEPDGAWAKADESIKPLTAVVIINFFSIGETSMQVCFSVMFWKPAVRITILEKPALTKTTFEGGALFRELRPVTKTSRGIPERNHRQDRSLRTQSQVVETVL
jgi:hypothetical protein